MDCTRQVYNLGNGGVPVHHDPVDGIWANPGNRMGTPQTCRKEAGAGSYDPTMTENTEYMSRAINLLYLFRYQMGGDFVST